ncbi:MAG: UvrD-helicase domain-containing protein, partial [Clostridia bacterium]|nr:UvrD-helicase domain-containing protein [Clostridia bacterium]
MRYTRGDVWVSTFHAMCVRILRREIEALSYSREFTIYDDDDQLKILSALIDEYALPPKEFPIKEIRAVIADAKNAMRSPKAQREAAISKREEVFADLYEGYEKKLRANNALDFDDLILKTTVLFDKFPDVREKYARRFRYIHVDEYQDTNMAQYVLIRQLASAWGTICVVGDDDQSIYGWRGADIRNILEFEKDFTSAVTIKLEQNYRSTNSILSAANAVIANNRARKKKKLWSENGDGAPVRVEELADGRGEAAFVVSEILNASREGKPYSEFAVLYRTNNQSRIMEEMLLGSGIPYRVYGGQPFYGRKEVKDAIAYLRLIV